MRSRNDFGLEEIDVVILCGGFGKRLGLMTKDLPKPMLLVGGRPFLEFLVSELERQGFNRFILCAGYKAEIIQSYFQKKSSLDINFSIEEKPLGTGGAIKNCQPLLKSRLLVVLNGDSFCRVDYRELLRFHTTHGGKATVVVSESRRRLDGGFVHLNDKSQVTSFSEKIPGSGNYMSAGIYVFSADLLNEMPSGKALSLENDFFPKLTSGNLYGFVTSECLYDIGTPERFEELRRHQSLIMEKDNK